MIELLSQTSNPWPATVLAGTVAIGIVLAALGLRRSPRPRGTPQAPAVPELEQAVAELGELTHRLEELIAQADQRIETLRDLTSSPAVSATNPLARRIYQLADSGRDSAQIAQELEEHIGKVELILALRTQTTDL